jgi:imidazolonepropionase-like amidohydrolase
LEQGKLADLLVVDGDPSVDISVLRDPENLLMIMKGGELVKDELAGPNQEDP